MINVLILSGENHGFAESAVVINKFLIACDDMAVTLTEEKESLAASEIGNFDVLVFGTGFTRAAQQADGSAKRVPELTLEQENGLFEFVRSGKGLVGIHGTGWWIGGRAVDLLGGHANWHPPLLRFTIAIEDRDHQITQGVDDFEAEDEIYMSAYDPEIHILASAQWHDRSHPMVWAKPYGDGRVVYTTLGHTSAVFQQIAMQRLFVQAVQWAGEA